MLSWGRGNTIFEITIFTRVFNIRFQKLTDINDKTKCNFENHTRTHQLSIFELAPAVSLLGPGQDFRRGPKGRVAVRWRNYCLGTIFLFLFGILFGTPFVSFCTNFDGLSNGSIFFYCSFFVMDFFFRM